MKFVVLTYHSHHVVGPNYGTNDHIAFEQDLTTITKCGFEIVSLDTFMDQLEGAGTGRRADGKYVGLTFDDGPMFDAYDFMHPVFGFQRSFLNAMRRFRDGPGGIRQPRLHATSFVIASPSARLVMEDHADPQYTYLTPGSMSNNWWNAALDTGLIGVANHSWDHLHPALPMVAHSRQARADFTQVDNDSDANDQILQASRYIAAFTRGRASPFFAYPFGHYNAFLTDHYLPRKRRELGLRAAFTTRPEHVDLRDSPWALPRFTCGHHWTNPAALEAILNS